MGCVGCKSTVFRTCDEVSNEIQKSIPFLADWVASSSHFFAMSLWAKSVNYEEQALEIEWATPGNVSQLKRAIALERRAIHLPDLYILNVRLDDKSDRRNNLSNDAHVSVPMPGEIGSSEDLPYFFSTGK